MSTNNTASSCIKIDHELDLYFEQSGNGQRVLLFIPGWTMSTRVFSEQLAFFRNSSEYRFITYDPRGHGCSSDTAGGHFYEQHGRDLHGFIQALALDDIVLCGWSFGVLDALAYIDQFGADKVSGLIMLDGAPKSRGVDNTTEWVSYSHGDQDGREEFFTMGPLRDRAATNVEFAKWMLEDPSDQNIEWILDIANQTTNETAALLNATGAFLDYTAVLKRLANALPLLYVVSEELKDAVTNWGEQNTPSARIEAFGKHLMFWERPNTFNTVLTEFLDSMKPRL